MRSRVPPLLPLALALALVAASCVTGPRVARRAAPSEPGVIAALAASAAAGRAQELAELDALAGAWAVVVEDLSRPEGPTTVGVGEARVAWTPGARFLLFETEIEAGGARRRSSGLVGYDAERGRYQLLWASEATGAMRLVDGDGDPRRGGILFFDSGDRPQTRLDLDASGFTFEQLAPEPGGGERAVFRTRYTPR